MVQKLIGHQLSLFLFKKFKLQILTKTISYFFFNTKINQLIIIYHNFLL